MHVSVSVVFLVHLCWFLYYITGLSAGQSLPAQVHDVRPRSGLMLLAVGPSAGASPGALGTTTRVKGVFSGNLLAQHDHPVLQVTDGARCAAGRTVQTPL